jgi:hypothetical protein
MGRSHKGEKLNLSDEERKRRSDRAKAMHREKVVDPETGEERAKFGGAQKSIAVKKTSDDLIKSIVDATGAEDVQVLVIQAYVDALANGTRAEKLRAAKGLVEVLETHKKQQLAERRALNDQQRTDLLAGVLRDLGLGSSEGGEILDGEFSVIDNGSAGRLPAGLPELEVGERAAD